MDGYEIDPAILSLQSDLNYLQQAAQATTSGGAATTPPLAAPVAAHQPGGPSQQTNNDSASTGMANQQQFVLSDWLETAPSSTTITQQPVSTSDSSATVATTAAPWFATPQAHSGVGGMVDSAAASAQFGSFHHGPRNAPNGIVDHQDQQQQQQHHQDMHQNKQPLSPQQQNQHQQRTDMGTRPNGHVRQMSGAHDESGASVPEAALHLLRLALPPPGGQDGEHDAQNGMLTDMDADGEVDFSNDAHAQYYGSHNGLDAFGQSQQGGSKSNTPRRQSAQLPHINTGIASSSTSALQNFDGGRSAGSGGGSGTPQDSGMSYHGDQAFAGQKRTADQALGGEHASASRRGKGKARADDYVDDENEEDDDDDEAFKPKPARAPRKPRKSRSNQHGEAGDNGPRPPRKYIAPPAAPDRTFPNTIEKNARFPRLYRRFPVPSAFPPESPIHRLRAYFVPSQSHHQQQHGQTGTFDENLLVDGNGASQDHLQVPSSSRNSNTSIPSPYGLPTPINTNVPSEPSASAHASAHDPSSAETSQSAASSRVDGQAPIPVHSPPALASTSSSGHGGMPQLIGSSSNYSFGPADHHHHQQQQDVGPAAGPLSSNNFFDSNKPAGTMSPPQDQQNAQLSDMNNDAAAIATNELTPLMDLPPDAAWNKMCDPLNLYAARFIRGKADAKCGACPICIEPRERGGEGNVVWFKLKNSSFVYHMSYNHGLSNLTGLPFSPPLRTREVPCERVSKDSRSIMIEGLCHKCDKWIAMVSTKNVEAQIPELIWWKHAKSCHGEDTIEGEGDYYIPDDVYELVLSSKSDTSYASGSAFGGGLDGPSSSSAAAPRAGGGGRGMRSSGRKAAKRTSAANAAAAMAAAAAAEQLEDEVGDDIRQMEQDASTEQQQEQQEQEQENVTV